MPFERCQRNNTIQTILWEKWTGAVIHNFVIQWSLSCYNLQMIQGILQVSALLTVSTIGRTQNKTAVLLALPTKIRPETHHCSIQQQRFPQATKRVVGHNMNLVTPLWCWLMKSKKVFLTCWIVGASCHRTCIQVFVQEEESNFLQHNWLWK